MILLDFFSGSHGHFLEYVINTWLFKGPRVDNIFTGLGASHLPRNDPAYMKHRIVCADHYSEFNKTKLLPNKLIRISVNNDWANWIYQINILSRAGDIPLDKKLESIPHSVKIVPSEYRNQWYAKFNLSDGYPLPGRWRWTETPAFDFPMESLFDLVNFYNRLHDLAVFLETTFVPDRDLGKLFENFLSKNQGWQCYKKCKQLVNDSLTGNHTEFLSDEMSQALINSLLSGSVGIFDGKLFDGNIYPANTAQVWDLIDLHLKTFDLRF